MFISLNLFYEYYVDFDWCRKVPHAHTPCSTRCTRLARGGPHGPHASWGDFSPVTSEIGHRGKIFPRAAGAAKTLRDHVLLVCRERLWGFRARR